MIFTKFFMIVIVLMMFAPNICLFFIKNKFYPFYHMKTEFCANRKRVQCYGLDCDKDTGCGGCREVPGRDVRHLCPRCAPSPPGIEPIPARYRLDLFWGGMGGRRMVMPAVIGLIDVV